MKTRRRIVVVTGTRAEFGLLSPVMRAIADHRDLTLRVIATGMHLPNQTWRDIAAAGFSIDRRVAMQRRGYTGRATDVAALGRGVVGLGRALADLRPDVTVVLGDRIEALAAALAASVGGFRLAHVHGGDRAQGVADEAMRHAISKLAHLHFPATAQSRRRLVRMGEPAERVFQVGSPALDDLADIAPAEDGPDIIVMQHPIGADDASEARWMRATLRATDVRGLRRLVLAPNADPGCEAVRGAMAGAGVVEHLPRSEFVANLKAAKVIVGNSSAGLIEAAAVRTACVNVGPRQDGREKPGHVIDCDYGQAPVHAALRRALRMDLRRLRHPYGDGRSGLRIAHLLGCIDLDAIPLAKRNTY